MANLDDVLTFVKVAQFESISGSPLVGNADLDGEPAAIGARVEARRIVLQAHNATVTLTAQGREYFNQCREPLTLLEDAERVLTLGQKAPEGVLRTSASGDPRSGALLHFLSGFLKDQPRIRIDLFITNPGLAENIRRVGRLERGRNSHR